MSLLGNLKGVLRFKGPSLDPARRRLARAVNVHDLRRLARRRLPAGVFDYIDGGAEDEVTLRRNVEAFTHYDFQPRVLRDTAKIDPATTALGTPVSFPVAVAPMGFCRIADPAGELAIAAAAGRAGVPYVLSTMATRSIEEVAAVSTGPTWFQVYTWKDRGLVAELLQRAHDARYEAIVLTVDLARLGRRERDLRRGFTMPPTLGPGTLLSGLRHPAWTWSFLRSDPIRFANVVGKGVADGVEPVRLADKVQGQYDPSLTWDDLAWFRNRWPGPIVLKGIQTVADARLAADAGVDAIVLSNHGGRQLDGAPAPLHLVAPVADAVGGRIEIYCDGGVRRGGDIVKALALGADGVMVGRPLLYGLAAGGETGVDHVFEMLRSGMEDVMALLGLVDVASITSDAVSRR